MEQEIIQEKKSHGALIGSIIIIIILLAGGIYIWQSKMKTVMEEKTTQEQSAINSENLETSTELDSLEQEINETDINTGVDTSKIE